MDKKTLKKWILLITFAIILYQAIENLEAVLRVANGFLALLTPLFAGICIAFIINLPLTLFERLWKPSKNFWGKLRRPVCMALSYVFVFSLVIGVVALIYPPLSQSATMLANNFDGYYQSFMAWAQNLWQSLNVSQDVIDKIATVWTSVTTYLESVLTTILPTVLKMTVSITSGVFSGVMAFILSAFLLYSKERFMRQVKMLIRAAFTQKRAESILEVASLSNNVMKKFVEGQLTESMILGVLCFVGMSIFSMPYALLISVIIGFTAIIPILGAFIGTIPSAFIILMIDPPKAFWFVLFILVLQQLEGDIIYPRVVGTTIGLSGLWVLLAVLLGGGIFGLPGMFFGVPVTAILYKLVARWTKRRVDEKNKQLS